jgi:hypothetical protein
MVEREKAIADWFLKNEELPGNEKVLIIRRDRPITRVVDLLGLDAAGCLVFLELKNETSTRRAIGQIIEYLSDYEDVSLDVLRDDYVASRWGATLDEAFERRFGAPLKLNARKRAFLVGPAFDASSQQSVQFLSARAEALGTDFGLIQIEERGSGTFSWRHFKPEPLCRASQLKQGFVGQDRRGRVFAVLTAGRGPVLWNVGKPVPNTTGLKLPRAAGFSRRGLRVEDRPLRVPEGPTTVDLSTTGQVFQRHGNPSRTAKVIGLVTGERRKNGASEPMIVFAELRDNALTGFRSRRATDFRERWFHTDRTAPDWPALVKEAAGLA